MPRNCMPLHADQRRRGGALGSLEFHAYSKLPRSRPRRALSFQRGVFALAAEGLRGASLAAPTDSELGTLQTRGNSPVDDLQGVSALVFMYSSSCSFNEMNLSCKKHVMTIEAPANPESIMNSPGSEIMRPATLFRWLAPAGRGRRHPRRHRPIRLGCALGATSLPPSQLSENLSVSIHELSPRTRDNTL